MAHFTDKVILQCIVYLTCFFESSGHPTVGANGAGKSTLLRVLSGRHLPKPDDAVKILGKSSFHDTSLNFQRAYLDTDWGMRTVAFAGYGEDTFCQLLETPSDFIPPVVRFRIFFQAALCRPISLWAT